MRCTATGSKMLIFLLLVMKMVDWLSDCEKELLTSSYSSVNMYKCFILNNIIGPHLIVTVILFFVSSVGT